MLSYMSNHDVRRLEIPVDDLFAVHILQGVHQLKDDFMSKLMGQCFPIDEAFERLAVYVFHHDGGS